MCFDLQWCSSLGICLGESGPGHVMCFIWLSGTSLSGGGSGVCIAGSSNMLLICLEGTCLPWKGSISAHSEVKCIFRLQAGHLMLLDAFRPSAFRTARPKGNLWLRCGNASKHSCGVPTQPEASSVFVAMPASLVLQSLLSMILSAKHHDAAAPASTGSCLLIYICLDLVVDILQYQRGYESTKG